MSSTIWILLAVFVVSSLWEPTRAWMPVSFSPHRHQWPPQHESGSQRTTPTELWATTKEGKQSRSSSTTSAQLLEEEETPAGVEGAQFFGGNKQKEEFFDPIAEAQASLLDTSTANASSTDTELVYDRFRDSAAFPDEAAAQLAQDLQLQVNAVLYEDAANKDATAMDTASSHNQCKYAPSVQWESPLLQKTSNTPTSSGANNPLQELEKALEFYNRVDLAITSAKTLDAALEGATAASDSSNSNNNVVELRWELSLAWPTVWEPRVLITGTSKLTVQKGGTTTLITKQQDILDTDLSNNLLQQLTPRFWDLYHIGMTPSAELPPKLVPLNNKNAKPSLLAGYNLYQLPPRLYLQPIFLDEQDREAANAGTLPNHAFTCIIKTMGPQRQRYVTASTVQVQIGPQNNNNARQLVWNIPLAVEYLTNHRLLLPPLEERDPTYSCQYVWQPRRLVATVAYGGNGPQDAEIAAVRQRLYESVKRDGLQPKLDSDGGRPIFFYWQNAVKVCYTEEGLGMAVYEWRPRFAKSDEVGIELEWNNEK